MCAKTELRILSFIFALLIVLFSAGCGAETPAGQGSGPDASARKLIIDTDTGADDASALILAAKSKDVEILGVTVLAGNVDVEQGAKNALAALETAGSKAPVFKGSTENFSGKTINAFSVFGGDGMGDAGLISPKGSAREKDAVDFILETVRQYPDEVEIVLLGPATNIAKAIEREPETMKRVKKIWSMGTTGLGPGNASPVAEFNVYADASAYKKLLDSGAEITVVGMDVCSGEAYWTDAQFKKLESSGDIGKFVTSSMGVYRSFYASNGAVGVMNADALAMTCVLRPDFIQDSGRYHGSCITDPGETYAQVIFYREGFTYDAASNDFDYNVTLVTKVDKEHFFDLYLKEIKK